MTRTGYGFRPHVLTLTVLAAVGSGSSQAQQAVEEVLVTGTRIRDTDGMVTPVPVTAVRPDEIRDFDPSSTLSEQLDNLPQFLNTQTAQRGGATLFGDAAGSYLNLRNMGKQRTLVLFDGSRIVPADRASSVNVDNFPTALIRSIEVVTGGASAAYGADALAGVVNFVLDREFEGLELRGSTGVTEMGDGENWSISVAGGHRLTDRLHVIGSVEARQIDQIYRDPRELRNWQSMGWVINPEWNPADPPGTHPQRITRPHVHSATQNPAGIIRAPGFSLDGYTFTEDGRDVRPFIQGDIPARTGPGANGMQAGGPEAAIAEAAFDGGPLGAEVVQRSIFGALKYDLSDSTSVFGQIMLGRTESNTHGRRGNPEMGQQYYATIYVDNAFMPETLRQAMIAEGLESIELHKIGQLRGSGIRNFYDNRSDENISRLFSATIGIDHVFRNGWDLRASFQRGDSKLTTAAHNIVRIDRWYMAMDAVRDPETGAIICNVQRYNPTPEQLAASMEGRLVATTRITEFPDGVRTVDSPIWDDNAIRDCQPLNIFGHGNVSQAAADYVVGDKHGTRVLTQDFAEVLLTGEAHRGWGAGPVSFAAGLTWREEWFDQYAAPFEAERSPANAPELGIRGMSPGITGGNRSLFLFSSTSWATGEFDVWEWFGEVNVPVWASQSSSRRLDTNFAFRRSDYSASGEIDSWKVGAEVQLFRDLRFRATRSRDVREPTFGEQFEAGGGGANIVDPVDGTSYTITALSGGNPNLRPEEADTFTAGFVYTPTFADWIDGFQLAADYYEIDVEGRVGSLGAQRIIDECMAGDQSLCTLITRSPITGRVERVFNVNLNVAAALTSGVDIEMRYQREPDFFASAPESLFFRLFAGYLRENSVTTTVYRDDVGSQASPEWNATATVGYSVGNFGVRAVGRYFDSTLNDVLWVEGVDVDDNTISSQTVWNLIFSYSGTTAGGGNWTANFHINNVFDRDPPIIPTQNQRGGQQLVGNNFDVFGRRYQASVTFSF